MHGGDVPGWSRVGSERVIAIHHHFVRDHSFGAAAGVSRPSAGHGSVPRCFTGLPFHRPAISRDCHCATQGLKVGDGLAKGGAPDSKCLLGSFFGNGGLRAPSGIQI